MKVSDYFHAMMLDRSLRHAAAGIALAAAACGRAPDPRPNVLWIVWDTVRADHLQPYGYARETTPFLKEWAAGARVFEDCLSTAGYTLPAHASMFTGLLPSEHCAHNGNPRLDDRYTTVAELLHGAGYQTYLYSANPHIAKEENFTQGFDLAEHPWSPKYQARALALVREKLPDYDRSSELPERLRDPQQGAKGLMPWNIKASGKLAAEAVGSWLAGLDRGRPFFVFLNYMEAHRPYIPPRRYRERLMSPADVDRSYTIDRSWPAIWEYTFGLRDYAPEEIELTRATYDATLLELDDLLRELLEALGRQGRLDNTVVILTADHGEQLGEQHMLDHQYSLYQPLLHVPLIVRHPTLFPAGRERRPVMNFDLFPTLLELAGVAPPTGLRSQAVSLLHPAEERRRFAEDPASAELGIRTVAQLHPEWDPTPWRRRLRALVDGREKCIWGSDGRNELYDLADDPRETRNLLSTRSDDAARLLREQEAYWSALQHCAAAGGEAPGLTPEQRELLRSLGYVQ